MKSHTKAALAIAFKWAAGLSAGFILAPIVMSLATGTSPTGKLIAEKLIVGIVWFPILFLGLWGWGLFTKKSPITGALLDSGRTTPEIPDTEKVVGDVDGISQPKSPSKWNYFGIGCGAFMLLFLFLPELIKGSITTQFYIGAAFWVGVIIYSAVNLFRAKK